MLYRINHKMEISDEVPLITKTNKKLRLNSIDIFRGLCLTYMILINNEGSYENKFYMFEETEWLGMSPADCVFPAFLFIMGFSITLGNTNKDVSKLKTLFIILKRFALLALIGFILNLLSVNFNFYHVRLYGVLQRLALEYLIMAIFFYYFHFYVQIFLVISFFSIYVFFSYYWYVPNCGHAILTNECFAGGYIDRLMFGINHIMSQADPEGILSTCTSFYTVYCGYIFGMILKFVNTFINYNVQTKKLKVLLFWSIVATVNLSISLIIRYAIRLEFSKKMYSPSFAFIQVAISGYTLMLCFILTDVIKGKANVIINYIFQPQVWLGRNSIVAYVGHELVNIILSITIFIKGVSLWDILFENVFNSWIQIKLASFVFGIMNLLLIVLIVYFLHKKKIFIKL